MDNMLDCPNDCSNSASSNIASVNLVANVPTSTSVADSNSGFSGSIRKPEDSTPTLSHSNYFSNQSLKSSFETSHCHHRHPNSRLDTKSPIPTSTKTHLQDLLQVTFPSMETYWSNLYQGKSDLSRLNPSQTYHATSSAWPLPNSVTSNESDGILSLSKFTETNMSNRNLADLSDLVNHPDLSRIDSDHYTKLSAMHNSSVNPYLSMEKYRMKHDNLTESHMHNEFRNQTDLSCQTNHCREMNEVLSLSTQTLRKSDDFSVYQTSRKNCEQSNIFYDAEKSFVTPQSTTYFDLKYRSDQTVSDNSPASSNHKHKGHIKKPLNAFMLFMKEKRTEVMAECTLKESAVINQILGRKWHALTREEQSKYYEQARQEKEMHQRLYPGWSARDNYACQARRKKRRTPKSDLFLLAKNRQDFNPNQCDDKFMLFKNNKTVDMPPHSVCVEEHSTQWLSNSKINYQTPVNISQSWKKNNLMSYDVLRQRDTTSEPSPFSEQINSFLVNSYPMELCSVNSKVREPSEFSKHTCPPMEAHADKLTKCPFGLQKDIYYPDRQTNTPTYAVDKAPKLWTPNDTNPSPSQRDTHGGWLDHKSNHPSNSCLCYSPYSTGSNFTGTELDNPRLMLINSEWSNPSLVRNPKPPVPDLLQSTCHSEFSSKQLSNYGAFKDGLNSEDFERRIGVNHSSADYNHNVAATVAVAAAAAYALKTNCWSNTGFVLSQSNPRSLDYLDNKQVELYSPRSASTPESSQLQQVRDELQ